MTAPVDLDALATKVAPLVAARLAAALGATQAPFSTRKGGEVPPEFQGRRKAWLATAPTIPGAVKLGRWWSVPRPAFAAWVVAQAPAPAPATPSKPWHPRDELPALRLVEGRAR
jgi:hypothetical protein